MEIEKELSELNKLKEQLLNDFNQRKAVYAELTTTLKQGISIIIILIFHIIHFKLFLLYIYNTYIYMHYI